MRARGLWGLTLLCVLKSGQLDHGSEKYAQLRVSVMAVDFRSTVQDGSCDLASLYVAHSWEAQPLVEQAAQQIQEGCRLDTESLDAVEFSET